MFCYNIHLICEHTNTEAIALTFFCGVCTQKFGDDCLDQRLANCGLWAVVFVNKVLLVHSYAHSFIYCLAAFELGWQN